MELFDLREIVAAALPQDCREASKKSENEAALAKMAKAEERLFRLGAYKGGGGVTVRRGGT
jgi:hypothetical protein